MQHRWWERRVATPAGPLLTRRRSHRPLIIGIVIVALVAACSNSSQAPSAIAGTGASAPPHTASPSLGCASRHTIAYASYPDVDPDLTSLDLYTPPADDHGCTGRPMVIWVHGGGWTSGDKTEYMADKVALFNGAGYVFASVNYRLTDKTLPSPAPQYPVHDQDTADAVAWLVHHAGDIGVDPKHVALFGHSAGGGIVAAIATDQQYLGKNGLPLTAISCAGSMDGEGYDIVAGATTSPPEMQVGYRNAFSSDPAVWEQASPIRHVAANKGIAGFFIAARGSDWRFTQHLAFIDVLRTAGIPTTVLDATTLEHADLTTQVGAPGDTLVTPALMSFLSGCFLPTPP